VLGIARRAIVALLRGEGRPARQVYLAEGMTDTLAAAMFVADDVGRRDAVLGITAGTAAAYELVKWPRDIVRFIVTDDDGAGEKYAIQVKRIYADAMRIILPKRPGEKVRVVT